MAKESYNPYGFWPATPNAKTRMMEVAASQTFAAGDPLVLSSGQVAVAVQNSSTELCGIAAEACASLDQGTEVAVWADPDQEFFGRCNADASGVAVGTLMDLDGTTGAFEIDENASDQDLFCHLGVKRGDDDSQAGAQLRVRIAKHAFADVSS